MAKLIELKGISKSYDGEKVIDCMNLYIRDGEFITLLGPSGCGKTTTLRIIGGFETADEGELYFDGKEISDVPAYKRHINTVFQKYALFPHLNVYENIAFPLRLKKKPEDEIKRRVSEMLKMVALSGFETADEGSLYFDGVEISEVPAYKRHINTVFQKYALFPHLNVYENIAFPLRLKKKSEDEIKTRVTEMLKMVALSGFENKSVSTLSGGQQQRVAIARALISHPKVLLLDEPLGALDLKLRKDMQNELKTIQQAIGITFIYVTHDQEEALSMSDTVVVMADGEIQQIGTPTDIYNEPKNAFVADFIGESNIIDGVMLEDGKAKFAGHVFTCVDGGFEKNEQVDVVVRPEDVDVVAPEAGMLTGTVTSVTFKGVHYEIIVDIKGFKWMIQSTDYVAPEAKIGLFIEPDAIHIMKKSKYSGMFGDYSSFSDEIDQLSDADTAEEF